MTLREISELRKDYKKFAKYIIDVIQAFEDGKTIECSNENKEYWETVDEPLWSWFGQSYRIKPEPKVVPFSLEDIIPGMYLKRKNQQSNWLVTGFGPDGVATNDTVLSYRQLSDEYSWSTDLKTWKPFHKVIEES